MSENHDSGVPLHPGQWVHFNDEVNNQGFHGRYRIRDGQVEVEIEKEVRTRPLRDFEPLTVVHALVEEIAAAR